MSEIIFLEIQDVIAINARSIKDFGGTCGVRDIGLLESSLNNPKNLYFYKDADFYEIAVSYAFSIIQNYAFLDGNKRTGFSCMTIFLLENNTVVDFEVDNAVEMMVKIATKDVAFEDVVQWLRSLELV